MLSISMETSLVTALLITLTNCIVPGWKPGQVNGEFQTDWLCLVLMRDAQGTAPLGTQLWFALGSFSLMAKTHPKENPNTFIWSCMRPAFSKEKSSCLAEQFFFSSGMQVKHLCHLVNFPQESAPARDEVGQDSQKPFDSKCPDRICLYAGFRQLVIFAPYLQDECVSLISRAKGGTADMGREECSQKFGEKAKAVPFLHSFPG